MRRNGEVQRDVVGQLTSEEKTFERNIAEEEMLKLLAELDDGDDDWGDLGLDTTGGNLARDMEELTRGSNTTLRPREPSSVMRRRTTSQRPAHADSSAAPTGMDHLQRSSISRDPEPAVSSSKPSVGPREMPLNDYKEEAGLEPMRNEFETLYEAMMRPVARGRVPAPTPAPNTTPIALNERWAEEGSQNDNLESATEEMRLSAAPHASSPVRIRGVPLNDRREDAERAALRNNGFEARHRAAIRPAARARGHLHRPILNRREDVNRNRNDLGNDEIIRDAAQVRPPDNQAAIPLNDHREEGERERDNGRNDDFDAANDAQHGGELEIHVAMDELLGLRGPLYLVWRNIAWLLTFNATYIGLFAFIPYSIGYTVLAALYRRGMSILGNWSDVIVPSQVSDFLSVLRESAAKSSVGFE